MPCPSHALLPFQSSFLISQPWKSIHKPTTPLIFLPLSTRNTPSIHKVETFFPRIKSLPSKEETQILTFFEKDFEILQTISQFNDLFMAFVALKLLSNISSFALLPNCRTYSIMIRFYCKTRDLDEATRVLDHMITHGCNPNAVTITILFNALCKRGKMQKAFQLFELMGKLGCPPNVHTYNFLLKGLCFVGRVEEACEKLMEMKNLGLVPDIYTFTSLMDGLCKVGRSDEAMELLHEAEENGLIPNVVTFNTLFNGYCKEGRPSDGIDVLNKMKEMNCQPDHITYTTLLHGLVKWGEIRIALRTYKEMVGFGHEVDPRMMNTFMRALCRTCWKEKDLLEDAHQVFEKMKNEAQVIDLSTYDLVIAALCLGNRTAEALANLHHMIQKGYSPGATTIDVIVGALCRRGNIHEALHVLGLARDGPEIALSTVSYNLLIDELNQQGMRFSACNVYGSALKQGVMPTKRPQ